MALSMQRPRTSLSQKNKNRRQQAVLRAISVSPDLKGIELTNQLRSSEFASIIFDETVQAGLPLNAINRNYLAKGINYRSAAEVKQALANSATWLHSSLGGRQYALILETHNPRSQYRGTHWLAHKAIEGIGHAPATFLSKDMLVDPLRVLPAYKKGVRDFVFFDDGTYSGQFVLQIIRPFYKLAEHFANIRLFVATGFASPVARTLVATAQKASARPNAVKFYSPQTMKTVGDFIATLPPNRRGRLSRLMMAREDDFYEAEDAVKNAHRRSLPSPTYKLPSVNLATQFKQLKQPMTVLAHKVPNSVSVPGFITALLERHHKAPYKKLDPKTLVVNANDKFEAKLRELRKKFNSLKIKK